MKPAVVDLTCIICGAGSGQRNDAAYLSAGRIPGVRTQILWLYDSASEARPDSLVDLRNCDVELIDVVGQADLRVLLGAHIAASIVCLLEPDATLLANAFAAARDRFQADPELAGVTFAPAYYATDGRLISDAPSEQRLAAEMRPADVQRHAHGPSAGIPESGFVSRAALLRLAAHIEPAHFTGAYIFALFRHFDERCSSIAEFGIIDGALRAPSSSALPRKLPRTASGGELRKPVLTCLIFATDSLWPISKTIATLTAQTMRRWEAIVFYPPHVELKRVATALDTDGRIRCIALPGDRSRGAEIALGASLAKGEIVTFLRAGNTVPPDHFEKLRTAFAADATTAIVMTPTRLVMVDEQRTGWISSSAFACHVQDPLHAVVPRVPLDAVAVNPARLNNFAGFAASGFMFAHWELLAVHGGADAMTDSLVDYTVRLKDTGDDCNLDLMLADFDLWQRRSAHNAVFANITDTFRAQMITAHARLAAEPASVSVREAWYSAAHGASLELAAVLRELDYVG
jgi:hypothetical protein